MADTRTSSPAMGNPPTLKTVAAPARMPAFSTASAMLELWEKACSALSADELAWFADGAARQVSSEARALGNVLEQTAVFRDGHDSDLFTVGDSSSLFLNLHHQLKTIEGLAEIAVEAADRRARLVALEGGAA